MILSERRDSTAKKTDVVSDLLQWLGRDLPAGRFKHSLEVAELSGSLCLRFGEAPRRGFLMGLGHDIAREYHPRLLRSIAGRDGEPLNPDEEDNPVLLHGRAGAVVLQERFGIDDQELLEAVRRHTLGFGDAGPLAKILFVADFCEASREFLSPAFRENCLEGSLDRMVRLVIEEKRRYRPELALPTLELYRRVKGDNGEG